MGACFSTATLVGLAANILQQQNASTVAQPAAQVTPAIALNYLQQFYSDGIYGSYPNDYWTSANSIEALVNYMAVSGNRTFATSVEESFDKLDSEGWYFASGYFDDQLWWTLAWLRQFEVSGDDKYLSKADWVVRQMLEVHGAWNGTCGGGVYWGIGHYYKNTITNTLFGVAAAKLHAFGRPGAAGLGYDAWATDTWAWLRDVQMLNASTSLLVDGLGPSCEPTGAYWTYNQGMFVRLGVEVSRLLPAANGTAALDTARAVVAGAAAYYAGDSNMTMVEKACGGGSCGHDGMAFKGVFMRDLGYSMEALAGGDGAALAWYRSYVGNNTAALCSRDAQRVNAAHVAFGEDWAGPYATSAFPYISQTAGIDLLNAWSGAGPAGDGAALALILRELGMSAEEVLVAAATAATAAAAAGQ